MTRLNQIFCFHTYGLTSSSSNVLHRTRTFELGGRKWIFYAHTLKPDAHAFSVICKNSEHTSFELTGGISILDVNDQPAVQYEFRPTTFASKRNTLFTKDNNGVRKAAPFLRGTKLIVRLIISIQEQSTFDKPTCAAVERIVVEDKRFYVPKQILEANSPMFVQFFCADFEEGEDIVLEGDSLRDFEDLLRFLQPNSGAVVTKQNVMGLLKVAFKYTFPDVLTKCEDFLIADFKGGRTSIAYKNYLNVAVNYQLYRLQNEYLSTCSLGDIRSQFASGEFSSIAKNIVRKAIDRFIVGDDDASQDSANL